MHNKKIKHQMPMPSFPSWSQASMVHVCDMWKCYHLPQACSESELESELIKIESGSKQQN